MRLRYHHGMLNYIWFGLMAIALVVAVFRGSAEGGDQGRGGVSVHGGADRDWPGRDHDAVAGDDAHCRGRGPRLDRRAGAAAAPARLFPEVPPEHPAAGAIVVALAANMLGLNNAATPLGIKAMEELQALNPDKDTASNPMVTFWR